MTSKKYRLTSNKKEVFGKVLFQIEALKDFSIFSKGELGGWIESESNLEQSGNAWVSGDAWVYGNAWVSGNAWVYGNAWVSGNAWVYGNARVSGKLKLKLGFYFGMLFKGQKIKKIKTEDGDLIWKE